MRESGTADPELTINTPTEPRASLTEYVHTSELTEARHVEYR